jgi:hypothetical protein
LQGGQLDLAVRGSCAGETVEMKRLANTIRELGPYAAIVLVLPGGSLIALAVWIFQRRAVVSAPLLRLLLVVAAVGGALILPGST